MVGWQAEGREEASDRPIPTKTQQVISQSLKKQKLSGKKSKKAKGQSQMKTIPYRRYAGRCTGLLVGGSEEELLAEVFEESSVGVQKKHIISLKRSSTSSCTLCDKWLRMTNLYASW